MSHRQGSYLGLALCLLLTTAVTLVLFRAATSVSASEPSLLKNQTAAVTVEQPVPLAPQSLTQNVDPNTVGGGVSCQANGVPTDNSWWRLYDLNVEFGITGEFCVTSVDFGVSSSIGHQNLVGNVYCLDDGSPFETAFLSLAGSALQPQPDTTNQLVNIEVEGCCNADTQSLVVELLSHDCLATGECLETFVGANGLGQTAPSYISAADCGLFEPIDLAAIGFPDTHIIQIVHGQDGILGDTDGDGVLDDTDNCVEVPNPLQTDTDTDRAGDPCDPCPADLPGPGCPCLRAPAGMVGWWQGEGNAQDSWPIDTPCDCCGGGDTVGCDCPDCESTVCADDPFCCTTSWDTVCDQAAVFECSCCPGQLPGACAGGVPNDGSFSGTYAAGRVGQAFSFDALLSDSLFVIDVEEPAQNLTEQITIDAWINPTSFPGVAPSIVSKSDSVTTLYSLAAGDGVSAGVGFCHIPSVGPPVSGGSLPLSSWTHVACAYDGSFVRLYVNGSEVGSTPASGLIASAPLAFILIGNSDLGGAFDGLIDEVEIFARALTEEEIREIYFTGAAGKCRDADQDGSATGVDCDDTIGTIFPGAAQHCDGLNNDCLDGSWPAMPPDEGDTDGDTLLDCEDNCPNLPSLDQTDTDGDGLGDLCDTCTDSDNDGFGDPGPLDSCPPDNCPLDPNPAQEDNDGDGAGDACDTDDDNDGILDDSDNCPYTASPDQTDTDGDGVGDPCDTCDEPGGIPDFACACTAPPPGMNAWWNADGDGADSSPSDSFANDAFAQNAAGFASGRDGQAFSVGVADTFLVFDQAELDPAILSIDAWVFPTSFPSLSPAVVRKADGGATQYMLALGDGATAGVAHCNFVDGVFRTGGTIPLNQWTHVACTYDGSRMRLYVNGAEVDSGAVTGSFQDSPGDLAIGSAPDGPGFEFEGRVDEVEIYDRGLTAHEVWDIYLAGGGGKCKDADADGFDESVDCDDNDGTAYPGAPQICDGINNDCNDPGWPALPADEDDDDLDGVIDCADNCPNDFNDTQDDADGDGTGDVCDPCTDSDGDGFGDPGPADVCPPDNCPTDPNPGQENLDGDALGDVCDPDDDGDGVPDTTDNCPVDSNPFQEDTDGAGAGDVCDPCTDPGGVPDPFCTCVPAPANLVSWWPGDGNAGDIEGANDGTLQNGATFAPGRVAGAFSIDGIDDFVRVEDSSTLEPSRYTLLAWVNVANQPPTGPDAIDFTHIYTLLQKGTAAGALDRNGYGFDYRNLSDVLHLSVHHVDTADGFQQLVTPVALPTGEWHQVAATYDGSSIKIYVDGLLIDSLLTTVDPDYAGDLQALTIGGGERGSGPFAFFHGLLDEVMIFDRAVTGDEIRLIYIAGAAGTCKDVDGDGFFEANDCDDNDATVFPGAPQICDGQNNDCNDPGWPVVPADEDDDDLGGVIDCADNCPAVFNDTQDDADGDGLGDVCDDCTDSDGDGFGDPGPADTCAPDNCPADPNPGQENNDADALGDVCDPDDDNDGLLDTADNCPTIANPTQEDADGDGLGDVCDDCTDSDNDGFGDPGPADTCAPDNCPLDANPGQQETDGDLIGDACDTCTDSDGDGWGDPGFFGTTCAEGTPQPLAFTTWTVEQYDVDDIGEGDAASAVWLLSNGDATATQTLPAEASILLGDFLASADRLEGRLRVDELTDDDYIGFAFGYQDRGSYYLFSWRRADQVEPLCGFTFERGMTLLRIDGGVDPTICELGITAGSLGNATALRHNTVVWADSTDYTLVVEFRPGTFRVEVRDALPLGGAQLESWEVADPTFTVGNVGLYSSSQAGTTFSGFTQASVGDNCPNVANAPQGDLDLDQVGNLCDNCPQDFNPFQEDLDNDSIGDLCDFDDDNDGVLDTVDNCPGTPNPDQADADGDGTGDACDTCTDVDGDGFGNPGFPANTCATDNCPGSFNDLQENADGDNLGDVCDNCPGVANNNQADADGDGAGDVCDVCTDTDGDGAGDPGFPANTCATDNCPTIFNDLQEDGDGDNIGDVCDNCPANSDPDQTDTDGDGLGNPCDTDDDGDGLPDTGDNCPLNPNALQEDADTDGLGDPCDPCTDTDGDGAGEPGFPNFGCSTDNCPGLFNDQTDTDGDGLGDACDDCLDTDNDGFGNPGTPGNVCPDDNCPSNSNPDQTDTDGDGDGDACDTDDDGDGVPDTGDNCPLISNAAQTDDDLDGIGNPCDNCPAISNPSQSDFDNDNIGDPCDTPQVKSVNPPNNSVGVPISTTITVTFTKAMNASTLTEKGGDAIPDNFRLLLNDTPFEGNVNVPADGLSATFDPSDVNGLPLDSVLRVELTSAVESLTGEPLPPFDSFFQTQVNPPTPTPLEDVSEEAAGPSPQALNGTSLDALGDLNADGLADAISGAPGFTPTGGPVEAGAALIYFGSPVEAERPVADLIFVGPTAHARAGSAVAGDFDFNGDGNLDILIGSEEFDRTFDPGGAVGTGKAYLIYFDPTDLTLYPNLDDPSTPDVIDLSLVGTTVPGVVFEGVAIGDRVGFSLAAGGLVNVGGGQDILIGAPGSSFAGKTNAGKVYGIFDDPALSGSVSLADVASGGPASVPGLVWLGDFSDDELGFSCAFGPKITNTLLASGSALLGAPGSDGAISGLDAGSLYGSEIGDIIDEGEIEVCDVGATQPGFQVAGTQFQERLGSSVDGGSDNLVDGVPDILVGAPGYDGPGGLDVGRVIHISDIVDPGIILADSVGDDPANPGAVTGVRWIGSAAGDQLGFEVTPLSDVTGDGFDDVALGAPFTDPNLVADAGTVYLIDGGQSLSGVIQVADVGLGAIAGEQLVGVQPDEHAGSSIAGTGDLDGDGIGDFVVGAPDKDDNVAGNPDAGTVYIVTETDLPLPGSCGVTAECTVADLANGAQLVVPAGGLAAEASLAVDGILDASELPAAEPAGMTLLGAAEYLPEGLGLLVNSSIDLPTVQAIEDQDQLTIGEPFDVFLYDTGSGSWQDSLIDGTFGANPHYPSRGAVSAPGTIDTLRTYAVFILDADGDAVRDSLDNCPSTANPDQQDTDGDGAGDACDPCPLEFVDDEDGDGLCCPADNCCLVPNPSQLDADLDGFGDACDTNPSFTVSSDPGDVRDFATIQEAVDAVVESGTSIRILPGLGTYAESVLVDEGLSMTLVGIDEGAGVPTVDGGPLPAFSVVSTQSIFPIELRVLTLRGATGLRASVPTVLENVTFGGGMTLAIDLDGGGHAATGVTVASPVAAGIDVAAGASLTLKRASLTSLSGTALTLAGTAELENVLIGGAGTGITVTSSTVGLTLAHTTVAGSTAGAGVDNTAGGTVALIHAIVHGNATGDLVNVACASASWSLIGSPDCSSVNDNLASDPLLDASYRPQDGSPALDHGPDPATYTGSPKHGPRGRPAPARLRRRRPGATRPRRLRA